MRAVAVDPPGPRSLVAFRAVLAVATLAMLGLSWPLWVEAGGIPRVPFARGLPEPPAFVCWGAFVGVIAGLVAAAIGPAWRAGLIGSVALLGGLVVLDQNRLQPWAYQYLVTGLVLATADRAWSLRLARLFLIALYVHSGLSKLDVTFADELGLLFLRTGLSPFGPSPDAWPVAARRAAALGMAGFELAVGIGLALRATRRVALVGALAVHATLIGILGPWGLKHSTIVLVWNGAILVEDLLLFGPRAEGGGSSLRERLRTMPAVGWVVVAAAVLPFGERWGWWDSWPSFAVYASHNERTEIYVHRDDVRSLPRSIRRHALAIDAGPWLRIDLTGWSREARGVPFYPSGRVGDALAIWLARESRTVHPIRVVHLGRASRLSGRRERESGAGREAIERHAERYWLNARPAGRVETPARWGFGTDRAD
jgi:hypothetical protein